MDVGNMPPSCAHVEYDPFIEMRNMIPLHACTHFEQVWHIYGAYMAFLAGELSNIRSHTEYVRFELTLIRNQF